MPRPKNAKKKQVNVDVKQNDAVIMGDNTIVFDDSKRGSNENVVQQTNKKKDDNEHISRLKLRGVIVKIYNPYTNKTIHQSQPILVIEPNKVYYLKNTYNKIDLKLNDYYENLLEIISVNENHIKIKTRFNMNVKLQDGDEIFA